MRIDLAALDAARARRLECRGLSEALITKLRIQDGYELATLLGLSPSLGNRQAIREWVTRWLDAPGRLSTDFASACRDLRACIEEACQ